MASLSSNLVDNLAASIYKTKCKHGHDNNVKRTELNTKIVRAVFNTQTLINTINVI